MVEFRGQIYANKTAIWGGDLSGRTSEDFTLY